MTEHRGAEVPKVDIGCISGWGTRIWNSNSETPVNLPDNTRLSLVAVVTSAYNCSGKVASGMEITEFLSQTRDVPPHQN
ncbi:hypothetical protein TNCV_3918251 [Trichonephila clavipes]|nr:hypothetical protein TNCV_3918251 [Trichonephila clavipes]